MGTISHVSPSTREQLRPGKFSIPNQLDKTFAAATSLGWVETAGPFVIQGQSRENYIDLGDAERELLPLRQMLHAARAGQFDILVAAETDRFRSLLMQVFRRLSQYHIQLYFLNIPIDPVPPDQYNIYKSDHVLMMLTMSQMTSSLEISRTRRKWIENMPKRVTELGLPATSIPFGYRKLLGSQSDRKAVPELDPLTCPHVVAMKDLLLSGHSNRQIIDYLVENKVKPPRGKKWHPQTVRDILRNPFYAGKVRFGVSRVVIDPKTDRKKRNRSIPADQVQYGEGKHQPLWDWTTHQFIIIEIKRRATNYRGRSNNQFTGLLKCGVCGLSLWRQGNGPQGEHRIIWRCSHNGSARGHVDVPHVILLEKIARELKTLEHDKRPVEQVDEIKTPGQAAQLRELEAQLTRLEDAYLASQWDLARYTDRKRQIESQLAKLHEDQLEAELRELTRESTNESLKELQAIPDLATWLITSDPTETNQRLHFLIDHITVSEEAIKIVLK